MARRKTAVPKWPEVKGINDYAAFIGCLSMVTRGLGLLVVTWTTVVLLGGFVSQLQKKDFWSLTVITFIQIAGVVNNFGSGETWSSIRLATTGFNMVASVSTRNQLASTMPSGNIIRVAVSVKRLLGWVTLLVQLAAYAVVYLCIAFGILFWGLYIATGVSLWRLKQRDYGNADQDSSKANMNPALDVLYIIVVVQGAILVYRRILRSLLAKRVVAEVAKTYSFKGPSVALVQDYMIETRRGCAKNPSFAKKRNLVAYAVDLMGPDKPPQDYLSGLKILSTILGPLRCGNSNKFKEQRMLTRQLILYAPSSHIFRCLLVLSNPRSCPCGIETDSREQTEKGERKEMRKHAASILVHMADGASLEQLPQVIQCMSSLIGTFEEYHLYFSSNSTDDDSDYAKEEEEEYLERLWEGLHVLSVLAADENNCRLIIHTQGLLTKIITPLASNHYHQTGHDAWEGVLVESLEVMHRLTHGHGETRANLVGAIETNLKVEAVETMMRILRCDECSRAMETLAMGILTNLHMQMQTPHREYFIEMLADTYTYAATHNTRISALEALATLCSQDGSNAMIILQVNGSAIYSFTEDVEASGDGYQRYQINVAEILQHACQTQDDECLGILKESMTYIMPKVLKKILTSEATSTGQQRSALQDNGQNRSSSSLQQMQEQQKIRKIESALLSLCVTVHETFISVNQYLAVPFDEAIREFSLPVKLREMVERNSEPRASCLKILKLISKMVISMMKCRGSRYPKQDLKSLVEALWRACSRKMYFIDSSMDFASSDNAAKIRKPERTLLSFVREATDLVQNYRELGVMAPSTIVLKKILTTGALHSKVQNRRIQTQRKTETSLLSLCVTVHEKLISADQHLALQFDSAVGELSLPLKLRETVERNSDPMASCLKILKLTNRMAISMMKCRDSTYPKPDMESLVEALLKACSRNIYFIDRSMDFRRGDNVAKPRKPQRILASFVPEAMEIVRNYREKELEVMAPSTIVYGEASSN